MKTKVDKTKNKKLLYKKYTKTFLKVGWWKNTTNRKNFKKNSK